MLKRIVIVTCLSAGIAAAQMQIGTLPIPQDLSGSVPTGDLSAEPLQLTLLDAIQRGLKYNIGVATSGEDARLARSERLRTLSETKPNLSARLSASGQQVDLAAYGFSAPGFPSVVGPFSVYDVRASLTQNVFDLKLKRKLRAQDEDIKASDLSAADIREKVVLVVTGLYLQALAGRARIESAQAQVTTAQSLLKNAQDRKEAGTSPAIDVLRAQVQVQALQQKQIYFAGEFQKQMLSIARVIGLPPGQKIQLADKMLSDPLPLVTLDELLKLAYQNRRDYLSLQASLKAAELARLAAHAEKYPTADLNANYGVIGSSPVSNHGTFGIIGGITIPIFQGGKVEAEEMAADTVIKRRRAELDNLRGQIDNEVRTGLIDSQNAFRQVEVARQSISLARQQLEQSQDRFRAGVTNNVEVVQAQEAVANAEDSLISSLFSYNVAKALLVRAQGQAEQLIVNYLKGK